MKTVWSDNAGAICTGRLGEEPARTCPGQVQSAIGSRVTVNFLHAGKRLINTDQVALTPIDEPGDDA
jgi:hypothetical protein